MSKLVDVIFVDIQVRYFFTLYIAGVQSPFRIWSCDANIVNINWKSEVFSSPKLILTMFISSTGLIAAIKRQLLYPSSLTAPEINGKLCNSVLPNYSFIRLDYTITPNRK